MIKTIKIKNLISIDINVDIKISRKINIKASIKKWWKKIMIFNVLSKNQKYYVHYDFGYYCIGIFDGFDGNHKAKLKVGDNNYIICSFDELYISKQPNMKIIYKSLF